MICCDDWEVKTPSLTIFLGQSEDCKGIRNNYEIRASGHQRAFNGANHKPDSKLGDVGYDERELTQGHSFAEIVAMMMACPGYQPRR
jgi:hypothetical protein